MFGWVGGSSRGSPCPALSHPSGRGALEFPPGTTSPRVVPVGGAAGAGVEATVPGSESIACVPFEGADVPLAGSVEDVSFTAEGMVFLPRSLSLPESLLSSELPT